MSTPAEDTEAGPAVEGRHAISRAIDLLRNIAKDGAGGARLIDLARRAGVPHPTARRILKILMAERMVVQSASTSRYRLGPLSYELGLATSYDNEIANVCRPYLRRLAALTEDTVYLLMRSGFDGVCIDRVEGSYPIRTVLLRVGGRRPLGVGPAGLALLAAMDDGEIHELLRIHGAVMHDFRAPDPEGMWRAIEDTRRRGFAMTRDWAVPGISGVGMVIPSSRNLHAAVSVSAISERLDAARAEEIAALVRAETAHIDLDNAFINAA